VEAEERITRERRTRTDLWKLITEYPDIFETHVLLSAAV
jgi:hypothetical protein